MASSNPEVRQCQDQEHWLFGAVAVRASLPGQAWGVFHPANGGHWEADDSTVGNWQVLKV